MEKTAHYFLVGLFVTATFFALIGFIIWLMGARDKQNFDFFTVELDCERWKLVWVSPLELRALFLGSQLAPAVSEEVAELHRAIAIAVSQKTARLSGEEVRFLRKFLGWSGADFARRGHAFHLQHRRSRLCGRVHQNGLDRLGRQGADHWVCRRAVHDGELHDRGRGVA